MEPRVDSNEALKFGFEKTKAYWPQLAGGVIVIFGLSYVLGLGAEAIFGTESVAAPIITSVLGVVLNVSYYQFLLRVVDGEAPQFGDLIPRSLPVVLNSVGVAILSTIAAIVGFILLFFPGVIISILLSQAPYLVVDKKMSVMEALKASMAIMKGHVLNYFVAAIVIGVVSVLGFLLIGIGALFTIPLGSIALLYIYRQLSVKADAAVEVAPMAPEAPAAA